MGPCRCRRPSQEIAVDSDDTARPQESQEIQEFRCVEMGPASDDSDHGFFYDQGAGQRLSSEHHQIFMAVYLHILASEPENVRPREEFDFVSDAGGNVFGWVWHVPILPRAR